MVIKLQSLSCFCFHLLLSLKNVDISERALRLSTEKSPELAVMNDKHIFFLPRVKEIFKTPLLADTRGCGQVLREDVAYCSTLQNSLLWRGCHFLFFGQSCLYPFRSKTKAIRRLSMTTGPPALSGIYLHFWWKFMKASMEAWKLSRKR